MSEQATNTAEPRMDVPVHLTWDGSMLLDAPPETVWPCLMDYPSWQGFSSVEPVSGDRLEEGGIVLLRKDEKGFSFPPYYALVIKLEPGRRVIWKTYPTTEDDDQFFGIVEFRLEPAPGGKTLYTYHFLYEFELQQQDEEARKAFRDAQNANFAVLFDSIFPKFERLVAKAVEDGRS